jgi:phage I-like protein
MNLTLLNSHFELPADHWYHVVPLGEFRHAEGDLLQVIDDRAVQSMVERFQHESAAANFPGLLVDFDHASQHATQPTAAAGWITELQAVTPRDPPALSPETRHRTPGLWAQIRWSDTGEAAVRGGRYRLVSPVWLAEDCEALPTRPTSLTDLTSPTGPTAPAHRINRPTLRPLRLHRLALTNDPNLRGMVPRGGSPDRFNSRAAGTGGGGGRSVPPNHPPGRSTAARKHHRHPP